MTNDVNKEIAKIAAGEELAVAQDALQKKQEEVKHQQRLIDERALETQHAQEQATFRQELAPAIKFAEAVNKSGLLDIEVSERKTGLKIKTDHLFGYETKAPTNLKTQSKSRHIDAAMGTAEIFGSGFYNVKSPKKLQQAINVTIRRLAIYRTACPEGEKMPTFKASNNLSEIEDRIEESITYRHREYDGGIKNLIFFGAAFERGEAQPEDVNTFITALVRILYEQHRDHPQSLKTLRNLIKKHFGLNLDSLEQSSKILAIAQDFSAKGNSDITLTHGASADIDLSVLEKTPEDIETEIKQALESQDPLAVLKIGSDVLDLSQGLISDLADIMLPAALGEDLDLVQSIQDDIRDLKESADPGKGKSLGTRLLSKVLKTRSDALVDDSQARITANFGALGTSLTQQRAIVEHRVTAIQKQFENMERLCVILETYKDTVDKLAETQSPQANDLKELKDIFSVNALAALIGKEGIAQAIPSEKQAYLAIRKTSNSINLLAGSLIQAVAKLRGEQTDAMLLDAASTEHAVLLDSAEQNTGPVAALEAVMGNTQLLQNNITHAITHINHSGEIIRAASQKAQVEALKL